MSAATTPPARYPDYYNRMSYKDYLVREAAGTLDDGTISTRSDGGEEL